MTTVTSAKRRGLRYPGGLTVLLACASVLLAGPLVLWLRPELAGAGLVGGMTVQLLPAVLFAVFHVVVAGYCLMRSRRDRAERLGWYCIAGAVLVGMPMVVLPLWTALAGVPAPGALTAVQVVDLLRYPLAYIGVLYLLRGCGDDLPAGTWLDGLVVAAALGAVALSAGPGTLEHAIRTGQVRDVLSLVGPASGIVFLLVVAAAIVGVRSASGTVSLVLIGFGLWAVGAASIRGLFGVMPPPALSVAVLAPGAVVIGIAAVTEVAAFGFRHGEWWGDGAPDRPPTPGLSWTILALPAMAMIASATVLALAQSFELPLAARLLAATGVVLALARIVLSLKVIHRLSDAHLQARTDDLTGLSNRRGFFEQTDRLMLLAQPRHPVGLLLLDLDRFKEVNDALGHIAGDLLLSQVGRRIARAVRPADITARLGGDEFAVLMPDTSPEEATLLAERILLALGRPFTLQTVTLHVEASIGLVNCPELARSRSEALRCADVAMYQAKRTRTRIAVYTQHDDDPDQLRTVEELRSTIAGRNPERVGSIVVLFQPQLDLATGLPSGVEALVRWQHPERGLLGPGAFLPLAQAAGLMDALTNVVCELALGACAQWWSLGLKMPVSINFPSSAVHDHALPTRISDLLTRHGLPPEAMTLEITEDMLMNDPPSARQVLTTLRALRVAVSVDDYGTGYSSLAYLRNLPVDELKLDRAFISGLGDDPGAVAIVQHVVSLAHSLGLTLVAEGIDDLATVQALAAMGCDVGQGFFFARPMPAGQLLIWLAKDAVALRPMVVGQSRAS